MNTAGFFLRFALYALVLGVPAWWLLSLMSPWDWWDAMGYFVAEGVVRLGVPEPHHSYINDLTDVPYWARPLFDGKSVHAAYRALSGTVAAVIWAAWTGGTLALAVIGWNLHGSSVRQLQSARQDIAAANELASTVKARLADADETLKGLGQDVARIQRDVAALAKRLDALKPPAPTGEEPEARDFEF